MGPMISDYDYLDQDYPSGPPPKRGVWWRVIGWASIAMAVVLVGTSLTAYAAYRKLEGNIKHEDVTAQLGSKRPPKLNNALNVLLIGSDQRNGANAKYGRDVGERSDTMILLHLSPGGKKAVGISFPRDSMVPIPSCKTSSGHTIPAQSVAMINSSFNNGGAACTIRTIESLTKIRIDHFVKVDFSGFKRVVDALGGVEICLPQRVADKSSKLYLSAGRHIVKGEQALAYVRMRHGLGDGSDLGRIKRQQKFLGAVVKKATSNGTLTNPSKLLGFLDAATKSVTTDNDFTVDEMKKVAGSVQGMSAGKVQFITVPWTAYAPDPNRIAWKEPDADNLFAAIRNDNQVQAPAKVKKVNLQPAQVKVEVLNGTATPGLAGRAGDQLKARGYQVVKVGTLTGPKPAKTEVRYGAGADQQAAALAQVVPNAQPVAGQDTPAGTVDLVLGPDWEGLKTSQSTSIPTSTAAGAVNAAADVCSDKS
ncbi:LCP family protein [Actinoallomurus rhizosphaericola]|uniref:LCP family protein n=1 Tax=Actinoallomurus rhizosphaericola TaxID=2952536 RepID=UPI002092CC6A|nr:LCP family protein [Actinoallomurus rhizosphaericola]MCO5998704.1 LCP family protein [Actinoallomurus rhizosphaericola]